MTPIYSAILHVINTCLFLFFLANQMSIAQEYIYQNFTVDDGLPSSEIYDIYQDKEGYIWFTTDKGISKYNGYEFENFDTSDGLIGSVVLKFYPQANGQIWCYTFHKQSLFYFDEVFNGFKPYKYNHVLTENLDKRSVVKSVFLDTLDNLHIGGIGIDGALIIDAEGSIVRNYGLENDSDSIYISKMVLTKSEFARSSPFSFSTKDTSQHIANSLSIYHSSVNMIVQWLTKNETAVFMTDSIVKVVNRNQEIIEIENKHSSIGLNKIDSSHFFVGYLYGGGKIIDTKGNVKKDFLKDKSISSFLIDHEGAYWFTTTSSGVFYLENPSTIVSNGLESSSNAINNLAQTKNQELLIAYKNGTIAKLINNNEQIIIDVPKKSTYAFVEYDTSSGKNYFFNDIKLQKKPSNKVVDKIGILKLSEPNREKIFAANQYGFYGFNENLEMSTFESKFRIHDVCVLNNDTILASPYGIYIYNKGNFDALANQSELFSYRSDDIDANRSNTMLFAATQGAGVLIYDGSKVFNLTESDGLNDNIINEVLVENDTTIWLCTNSGINKIIFTENSTIITHKNKDQGLLSNEVEDIEIINEIVYVGTKHGLCSFPKSEMNPKKYNLPYLKLQDVIVNNSFLLTKDSTSLSYKENDLAFLIEGISYAHKEKINYLYRLNKNQPWSSTKNRSIHFSSLVSGDYVFEAKVCVDNNNCSDNVLQYSFTIQEPFWRMWWFRLSCLFIIGLFIYSFFKIRVFTYNKDITREVIRLIVRKLKRSEMYFIFRENGSQVRVKTENILFVKSAGNYIDVHTKSKTHTIRLNIGKFLENVPDQLEYVRLHRSYIVRKDKITTKSKNEVQLSNGIKVPVSVNGHKSLKEVVF